MANRKRAKKEIPAHLEYLPPPPAEKGFLDAWSSGVNAAHKREEALHESRRLLFEETKNPLLAWDIYSRARRKKSPVPEWVMEYFDGVALRMLKAENETKDLPEILGFHQKKKSLNGGRQAWGQYHQMVIREEAVSHVLNYLRDNSEKTIDDACEFAAQCILKRWGVKRDGDTIKKWYHAFVK